MIDFVKGELFELYPTHAIIDVNGIGYKIFISASDYGKMPATEADITLHTSFIIRENFQALYGFLTTQERDIFNLLLTVSGIGPKMALALISSLDAEALHTAINTNDTALIAKTPGIGKKTAERLVIDIRDKFSSINNICTRFSTTKATPQSKDIEDAISALTNLGYNKKSVEKAINKTLSGTTNDTLPLLELITTSLKHI
ncbi:MAG: Holliday junction branch migration protein RuvA [Waddliaceae bacterium]|jgi:holliday junction DNA helicase RuvA|nr:Holliday junction branch migration protein RuvA [Waddliaceae bacterium]MBT3579156.1 Holliday junction branch migration protein RuvA [Waddliaceae bacterium]MBT4444312.1 Holliday junction branch migration protein RuvA [Waddliaceae bacterium]MBT6928527.1 Holliday junction branch migration protein RuvA [Waddliaceae bacterium]MBT7264865.1 Holliday junction branch migration protein RuvA [Waddliaceae bacterium]